MVGTGLDRTEPHIPLRDPLPERCHGVGRSQLEYLKILYEVARKDYPIGHPTRPQPITARICIREIVYISATYLGGQTYKAVIGPNQKNCFLLPNPRKIRLSLSLSLS